jgi:hypothetical protein
MASVRCSRVFARRLNSRRQLNPCEVSSSKPHRNPPTITRLARRKMSLDPGPPHDQMGSLERHILTAPLPIKEKPDQPGFHKCQDLVRALGKVFVSGNNNLSTEPPESRAPSFIRGVCGCEVRLPQELKPVIAESASKHPHYALRDVCIQRNLNAFHAASCFPSPYRCFWNRTASMTSGLGISNQYATASAFSPSAFQASNRALAGTRLFVAGCP